MGAKSLGYQSSLLDDFRNVAVYIYVCIHAFMYMSICMPIYVYICIWMYGIYVYTHLFIYALMDRSGCFDSC